MTARSSPTVPTPQARCEPHCTASPMSLALLLYLNQLDLHRRCALAPDRPRPGHAALRWPRHPRPAQEQRPLPLHPGGGADRQAGLRHRRTLCRQQQADECCVKPSTQLELEGLIRSFDRWLVGSSTNLPATPSSTSNRDRTGGRGDPARVAVRCRCPCSRPARAGAGVQHPHPVRSCRRWRMSSAIPTLAGMIDSEWSLLLIPAVIIALQALCLFLAMRSERRHPPGQRPAAVQDQRGVHRLGGCARLLRRRAAADQPTERTAMRLVPLVGGRSPGRGRRPRPTPTTRAAPRPAPSPRADGPRSAAAGRSSPSRCATITAPSASSPPGPRSSR